MQMVSTFQTQHIKIILSIFLYVYLTISLWPQKISVEHKYHCNHIM